MSAEQIFIGLVKGFVAGAGASVLGYLKNKGEDFSAMKFSRAFIVGGIVGAIGGGFGIEPTTVEEWLAYPLVVLGINAAISAFAKRVVAPLYAKIKELLA